MELELVCNSAHKIKTCVKYKLKDIHTFSGVHIDEQDCLAKK